MVQKDHNVTKTNGCETDGLKWGGGLFREAAGDRNLADEIELQLTAVPRRVWFELDRTTIIVVFYLLIQVVLSMFYAHMSRWLSTLIPANIAWI